MTGMFGLMNCTLRSSAIGPLFLLNSAWTPNLWSQEGMSTAPLVRLWARKDLIGCPTWSGSGFSRSRAFATTRWPLERADLRISQDSPKLTVSEHVKYAAKELTRITLESKFT